jgi:hypothetical protein
MLLLGRNLTIRKLTPSLFKRMKPILKQYWKALERERKGYNRQLKELRKEYKRCSEKEFYYIVSCIEQTLERNK